VILLPHYRRWAVYTADCLDVMMQANDQSVDHVLTDPPYSDALYERFRTNANRGPRAIGKRGGVSKAGNKACTSWDQGKSAALLGARLIGAIDEILEPAAYHFMRLSRRWVVTFHDCEIAHRWRFAFGPSYVRSGVWVKTNPVPQLSGDRPGQGFEPVTIAHRKGRKRWNGGGKAAVWRHAAETSSKRPDHPCPKPLSLMRELIEQFTDPDDLVLDPFCGSGTTGVAALELGRRFVGIERNPKFAALARRRCTNTERNAP
jgi:DNA modification methylase